MKRVDRLLPAILSTTAGAVDAIGFLGLGGLFTAHITGNLVVLAAHYTTGGFSEIGPLLSVPVFVAVLSLVTMLFANNTARTSRRALLALQAALLAAFLAIGGKSSSFASADSAMAIFAGMLGVAAMATQNALIKLALPGSPSTAVMTTNTTQLAVDLAIIARGRDDPEDLARARHRAGVIIPCVAGFIAGCASGGLLEIHFGLSALTLPVALAAIAIPIGEFWQDPV